MADKPPGEAGDVLVGREPAVLDIGGDIGALVLLAGREHCGREVEVSPIDDDARRVHTGIHERTWNGLRVCAGLFPQLAAGTYRIWDADAGRQDRVTIVGGQVAEVDWRRSVT